jgi:hypothetical protein
MTLAILQGYLNPDEPIHQFRGTLPHVAFTIQSHTSLTTKEWPVFSMFSNCYLVICKGEWNEYR